ncbi:MAG: hypothetical protein KKD41_16395 [Gammaproteobacteria bacterium]|nr:hypothetical protein [Gammaproteobacteria bacterium]
MTEQVKISISLSTGEVTIEAPASALSEVFDRLESFVTRLREIAESARDHEEPGTANASGVVTAPPASSGGTEIAKQAPQKRQKGGSGKNESYKSIDLGLTPEQRTAFKEFYTSKAPDNQSDHVLVVIYWLIQNTGREKVTMDEIFMGLRTVGEKIPKRISSVLSNLSIAAHISKENNEPRLLHVGEDHVMHNLPKTKKG